MPVGAVGVESGPARRGWVGSDVGVRSYGAGMSTDFGPTDQLYYAIDDLSGWNEYLGDARDLGANYRRTVGQLMSGIILAVGEELPPVAVGGRLDFTKNGQGYLVVVFATGIAYVDVRSASTDGTDYTISLHTFSEVHALTVRTGHIYYDGVESYPRHRNMQVGFEIAGHTVVLGASGRLEQSLTDSQSIYNAFVLIRDSRL